MRTNSFCYCFLALLGFFCVVISGCRKEHSCEGCNTPVPISQPADTLSASPVPDTLQSSFNLPFCTLCDEHTKPSLPNWSFTTGNTYVCGGITSSGFIGGKTTFTFFGPSACAHDTGMVMTVYLPVALDEDKFNITTRKAAFYYYDDNATKDIMISGSPQPFSVTVTSFNAATRMTTGTFSGTVFTADGKIAFVKNGSFSVKLQ